MGGVYLYFIANPAKSVRCEQKESRSEAIADSRKRNCPEMEPVAGFDRKYREKWGMKTEERLHRLRKWSVRRERGFNPASRSAPSARLYLSNMLPNLHLGFFTIHTFGLMMWLAAVAAAFVMDRSFRRARVTVKDQGADAMSMVAVALVAGIVGAKLWHIIDTPMEFR